jgi:hypothetical protein
MTRTIFGRRQVVLRQRARQDAWRRALQVALESRTLANERRPQPLPGERTVERLEVVSVALGVGPRLRDPRD